MTNLCVQPVIVAVPLMRVIIGRGEVLVLMLALASSDSSNASGNNFSSKLHQQ